MHSFQQIIVALFALLVCASAQSAGSYETTVYMTSTIYHLNVVTASGASPTGSVANQTSTIHATSVATSVAPYAVPSYSPPAYSAGHNGTVVSPSGTLSNPSPAQFTGAASALNANALVAALVAGVGYLAL
ncbi:hypothetical protein P153DRAFT_361702 [Dothidotthia symphoricarpi CBS 119687]|uniref:Uncharacterized protein n=1 Tax=Dothidotthia symphoricarpi CBS 119687 TaxID=1392245 RepID=A0A6A5ZWG8_9PLEO|nr:uncharacterized protein P153DRAFT_361702 [Dothidotthia symphoricarpi CBS 119687]KAF2124092.1 hypothetical protein P153DRAFT_361702 [Dothidotthia symphoricarpi CBS 119687]